MRQITATLALTLCLLGCGSEALPSDGVRLVTDDSAGSHSGCGLMPTYGELIADPTFGVAFKETGAPAVWPRDYTGWRVGTEVEVRNADGQVVATTGIGLQNIYLVWKGAGAESRTICLASRAADHLQPSHGNDPSPGNDGAP